MHQVQNELLAGEVSLEALCRFTVELHTIKDPRNTHARNYAHRGHAVLEIFATQGVNHGRGSNRAGRTKWMAKYNRATDRIDLGWIEAEILNYSQSLRSEKIKAPTPSDVCKLLPAVPKPDRIYVKDDALHTTADLTAFINLFPGFDRRKFWQKYSAGRCRVFDRLYVSYCREISAQTFTGAAGKNRFTSRRNPELRARQSGCRTIGRYQSDLNCQALLLYERSDLAPCVH